MTKLNKIENLENEGLVIVNLVINGQSVSFEEVEDIEEATAAEVVTVDKYEENDYEVEGLELTVVEL